jgi:hypothetical protein
MTEVTIFFEDFEAEAIHKAYEMTCRYRQELGDDIDNYDFNRFILNAILDAGIQSGQALTEILTEKTTSSEGRDD